MFWPRSCAAPGSQSISCVAASFRRLIFHLGYGTPHHGAQTQPLQRLRAQAFGGPGRAFRRPLQRLRAPGTHFCDPYNVFGLRGSSLATPTTFSGPRPKERNKAFSCSGKQGPFLSPTGTDRPTDRPVEGGAEGCEAPGRRKGKRPFLIKGPFLIQLKRALFDPQRDRTDRQTD